LLAVCFDVLSGNFVLVDSASVNFFSAIDQFKTFLFLFAFNADYVCENLELQIPDAPPLSSDETQNTAINSIRIFELEQMSYSIRTCSICHECRLEMKMSPKENVCRRCFSDKNLVEFVMVDLLLWESYTMTIGCYSTMFKKVYIYAWSYFLDKFLFYDSHVIKF
jgi:hypothetical protein